jgi:primosomal protein N' (replication factor Y)
MTVAERKVWVQLKGHRLAGYKFWRQHPIGSFIADFACTRFTLVIEVDGGQHCESEYDARRTRWLESQGWKVIRFWNNEVLSNMPGVLETILMSLPPLPAPAIASLGVPSRSAGGGS